MRLAVWVEPRLLEFSSKLLERIRQNTSCIGDLTQLLVQSVSGTGIERRKVLFPISGARICCPDPVRGHSQKQVGIARWCFSSFSSSSQGVPCAGNRSSGTISQAILDLLLIGVREMQAHITCFLSTCGSVYAQGRLRLFQPSLNAPCRSLVTQLPFYHHGWQSSIPSREFCNAVPDSCHDHIWWYESLSSDHSLAPLRCYL